MIEVPVLRHPNDYYLALFTLLTQEGQVRSSDAYTLFEQHFGHLIPQEHQLVSRRGERQWEPMLRSARQHLARVRLMNDFTSDTWSLTDDGRRWLVSHPDGGLDALLGLLKARSQAVRGRPAGEVQRDDQGQDPNSMAHAILDRQIARIRGFLRGEEARPTDDVLCDWVTFCYTFQLYAEGHVVFTLIDSAAVTAEFYERARRTAQACRLARNSPGSSRR